MEEKNTVNDLISELMIFSDALAFQANNSLLPKIGDYYYNSYVYDLNDFLLNKNNIFFRVYYYSSHEDSYDINNNERYMIITKSSILILASKSQKFKNKCIMEFEFEITWIESLKRHILKKYQNYIFIEIKWNNHSHYLHKFVFGIKCDNNNISIADKINSTILKRQKDLFNNYKYFEKFNDNDVATLEKIIKIKEEYLEISFSNVIYYQIVELYKNIINIFNSMNDEGYKKYIDKQQKFISKYM